MAPQLIAGYNPSFDVKWSVLLTTFSISVATTHPGVYEKLCDSPVTFSDLIQVNGRVRRAYAQTGFTFTNAGLKAAFRARYSIPTPPPITRAYEFLNDAYEAMTTPELQVL